MKWFALVCGLMILWAFVSLMNAPEFKYQCSFREWADARTSRLARALSLWTVGVIGLFICAIRACL
jgi:hypothetical protein